MDLAALPRRTGPPQVLAIAGSLRAGSANARLLDAAVMLAPPGMTIQRYQGLAGLPHFNPDLDTDAARPAPVRALRALVAGADALLLSSPEYAHGVPGSLKNALDWLVSGPEFPALPVGLLSPSPHATHAAAALREILRTMSAELPPSLSRIIPLAAVPDPFTDPAVAVPLRDTLLELEREIARSRAAHRRLVAAGAAWEITDPPAVR